MHKISLEMRRWRNCAECTPYTPSYEYGLFTGSSFRKVKKNAMADLCSFQDVLEGNMYSMRNPNSPIFE